MIDTKSLESQKSNTFKIRYMVFFIIHRETIRLLNFMYKCISYDPLRNYMSDCKVVISNLSLLYLTYK